MQSLRNAAIVAATVLVACSKPVSSYSTDLPKPTADFPCRQLDYEGRELRDHLARTIASERPQSGRAEVGLPVLPADSIILVSDRMICRRALDASSRLKGSEGAKGGVYVYRIMNRYVVYAPDGHPGYITDVMDEFFRRIAGWAY